jgi:hypothetical protein
MPIPLPIIWNEDRPETNFEVRQHPFTKVKGKADEVEVFEVKY